MLGEELTWADAAFLFTIFSWLFIWAIAYRSGFRDGEKSERQRIAQKKRERRGSRGYIPRSELIGRQRIEGRIYPCTRRIATTADARSTTGTTGRGPAHL